MDEKKLKAYALKRAIESERKGLGTAWPTLLECARHFKVEMGEVEDTVNSSDDLDLLVAVHAYNGIADLPYEGWEVAVERG